jgi:hypothetical protein
LSCDVDGGATGEDDTAKHDETRRAGSCLSGIVRFGAATLRDGRLWLLASSLPHAGPADASLPFCPALTRPPSRSWQHTCATCIEMGSWASGQA